MKKLLIFLGALAAYGTDCTISDTVRTPFGGYFAGRIVVALNSPGSAQPLYSGSQTLTGWQTTIEVPSTANGVVAFTLVCTDTITPSGTSYSARYQPTSGSGWAETWSPATGTTTIRAMRATTVPTPTTTFQASQIVPGSNGQVLTTTAGASAWGSVPACATCVVTSGSYADPAWITSLAGSKVSGAVASATLAASATALATPRTIAGVSFNGTANISIASTNLSDTANLVRNNAANTYTAGSKQTFTPSATTAGLNVGVQAAAPSSPAQGDVFFNSTLTRKGVYDGTQWRYELYAPSSGTGVVSWDGTSLSASTTLAGLASVTSTSFTGSLTGNASTATALASTVASGRLWIGQGTGVPTSDSVICADTTNHRLGVGTCSPAALFQAYVSATRYFAFNNNIATIRSDNNTSPPTINLENQAGSGMGAIDFYTYSGQTTPTLRWQGLDETNFTGSHYFYTATGGSANQPLVERLRVGSTVLVSNATLETTAASTSAPVWSMVVRNSNNGGTTGYGAGLKLKNSSESGVEANKWAGIAAIATATFSNDTAMAFYSASGTASAPTEKMRLLGTGNLLLGTTTDGNYKLDVANSGSSGTLRVYDQTATTGNTKEVIRAGEGQSTNLTEWQNSAGTTMAFINASGTFVNGGQTGAILNQTQVVQLGSDRLLVWGSTGSYGSTKDLGLARNAAGVLEINNGTAGTLRDLKLRNITVMDTTAVTGSTLAVIQAGAGQSGNLTEWRNNAGTVLGSINSNGEYGNQTTSSYGVQITAVGGYVGLGSAVQVAWSASTPNSTKDTGLARNAAGILEINNGTAGTYRDLLARIHTWTSGTEATCSSTTRGQVVMVQGGAGVADTLRVCRKDAADVYAWTALY